MKKNKKKWSKKFFQAKFATWNCWSLSNERYHYCKELNYDILGLTELHNTQANAQFKSKRWIHSAPAKVNEQGKCSDPAAGVAIMLSQRMAAKILDSGHIGARIVWVRLKGPVCNIFFIVTQRGLDVMPPSDQPGWFFAKFVMSKTTSFTTIQPSSTLAWRATSASV